MKIKFFIFLIILLFLNSCQQKQKINLAVNEWIGYAPLFYANEKGWLKKENIKLIRTVSLGESIKLFENGLVEAFTATQYEFNLIKSKVVPIILLDKSYGGDMILSNSSIQELNNSKKVDAYLELDSVNYLLLKYFTTKYDIDIKKFNFINKDQKQITNQQFDFSKPILIVTYTPYDIILKKQGFKTIASTKTDDDLIVIDALFIDKDLKNDKRFLSLSKQINKAILEIQKNPKKAYNLIKNYYPNLSFAEFKKELTYIKWINNNKKLLKRLENIDFNTKDLIYEN